KPRRRLRDLSIVQNTPNLKETNSEQQTAIGPSNVSNTPNEPVEIQKSTLLKDLYELNPIERVKVSRNNLGQPEKLRNVSPGMLRYQWEYAVRFWNSKKGEDRERVGTSSRQKQKFTHTAGSKSFACVAEVEELSFGQKVGRL
ncbi:hypothetical protein Gotur_018289, partial [Gossypium turneri]